MAGWILFGAAMLFVAYTYLLYPLLLKLIGRGNGDGPARPVRDWPRISITIPVYNEASQIADTLESLLGIDYPSDRRQVMVVSDASTDGTEEIVAGFADHGVELLRLEGRGGKTAAENAARTHLTGEIVINTDASIRIRPDAVKALVRHFEDPTVGVASGRDESTAASTDDGNLGESGYVDYEMSVRDLETRAGGIVGASGSLYAIRRDLHQHLLPSALSRDFASALVARENGYRAVSVPEAVCLVPRTDSLRKEFRRKVRTMVRGMETLYYKRHLLNPVRHGLFAWKLFSHKVCRWLVPWAMLGGLVGLALARLPAPLGAVFWGGLAVVAGLTVAGWLWPEDRRMPRLISIPTFAATANVAALVAGVRALRGELDPIWEPTRRPSAAAADD